MDRNGTIIDKMQYEGKKMETDRNEMFENTILMPLIISNERGEQVIGIGLLHNMYIYNFYILDNLLK